MGIPADDMIHHIEAMQAEIDALRRDLADARGEIAGLREEVSRALSRDVRALWDEGLASGEAGRLDAVFDELAGSVTRSAPAA